VSIKRWGQREQAEPQPFAASDALPDGLPQPLRVRNLQQTIELDGQQAQFVGCAIAADAPEAVSTTSPVC